jgi:DNA-binding NarL/FixJ family response regulator
MGDPPAREEPASSLQLLIADDSEQFRTGLGALVASVDGMVVTGNATNGDEAIAIALDLQPDVVLMDLNMPGRNGIEATRAIVSSAPHIAVLILTMHEDDESVFAAVQAGARGYLVKGARQGELLRAVRSVAEGGAVFGPAIARRMVDFFTAAAHAGAAAAFPDLTGREREILDLIARGRANGQIAEQLGLSTKTVRNHVSSIFTKMQVVDRAQAIVKAREAGIGGR